MYEGQRGNLCESWSGPMQNRTSFPVMRRFFLLWPEMKDMIHEHGGKNYTIFLDRETLTLFGCIEIEDEELWAKGADTAINRKWWDYMADIMETNPDNSPVSIDLQTVFHLD